MGFGFTSPHWHPRANYAGTYGDVWDKTQKPGLPKDFDTRFFNAAAAGLVVDGYLRGDEAVQSVGLSPLGQLRFALPGLPPPEVRVAVAGVPDPILDPRLDTVIVDFDNLRVSLLWRSRAKLLEGPHDVGAISVACPASLKFPRATTDDSRGRPAAN